MSQPPLASPAGVEPQARPKDWLYRKIDESQGDGGVVERFEATDHVVSPWGNAMHHGGPLAGLAVRAMERLDPAIGQPGGPRLSRLTMNLLGAVPVTELRTRARVVRPGRKVALLAAAIEAFDKDRGWREVVSAEAWRLATQPTEDIQHQTVPALEFEPQGGGNPKAWPQHGFAAELDWGGLADLGVRGKPTRVWLHMHNDLVEGEQATPLQQLVAIADCVNGIGARLNPAEFAFLNTDLTVHVHNPPVGPWFGMEAEATIGSDGVGIAGGVLFDHTGAIGRVNQSLLVERR